MATSLALVIIFVLGSCWWIYTLHQKPSSVLLHLALLLITPWIIVLSLARPSLHPLPASQPKRERITANANFFTSFEFLFFSGDRRPGYGIMNYGVFLPSFPPLIALGLLTAVKRKNDTKYTFVIWWLMAGLIISIVTSNHPVLPGALWFVPSLSLLTTLGLYSLIDLAKNDHPLSTRSLSLVVLAWLAYEAVRLSYILISWQPFTISS